MSEAAVLAACSKLPSERSESLERGGSASLSSFGHNSAQAEFHDQAQPHHFKLTGSQKKTAFALRTNAERMVVEFGVERIVFLTFTIGERNAWGKWLKVFNSKEASELWDRLNRREVGKWFERMILVTERHKDGGIHFHALAVVRERFGDVRTGVDIEAVRRADYSSAPSGLRALWREMRTVLPEFGFGRAQAEPVNSTGELVAAYVSKYIEKNIYSRPDEDKGSKLVRYIGWKKEHLKPNEFSWATPRACAWRTNARNLASLVGVRDRGEVAACFGPRWAFRLSRVMNAVTGNDQHVAQLGNSFPVRESARQLVLREAAKKWVRTRRQADARDPRRFVWNYRTPGERRQTYFRHDETATSGQQFSGTTRQ